VTRSKKARKPGRSLTQKLRATAQKRGMGKARGVKGSHQPGLALWKLLEDPLAPVRQAAAFALASVRDPALVQAFISALDGASSAKIARAALALGEAGYQNAAPYLMAAFTRRDGKLSAALARALGLLAEKSAAPLLMQALDSNFVPTEAAEALGRVNDIQAVPSLLRALGHKRDSVRAAAAYSLACLESGGEEQEREVRAQLSRLRGDTSRRVRLCAAVARYERGEAEALSDIKAALE
jgi:HEAT repeat protein